MRGDFMYMWMIYDEEGLKRNRNYVALYKELCKEYGIGAEAVLDTCVTDRITGGETPVFVLVRTINPEINNYLESVGIPVFNSYQVSRICNDKGRTFDYMQNIVLSVPTMSFDNSELSLFSSMSPEKLRACFRDQFSYSVFEEQEKKMVEEAEDFVLKAVDGHGGKQVFSVCHEQNRMETGIGQSSFVLQPMIKNNGVSRDMRVYVIGNNIMAAVIRSSKKDFRANFSRGGTVELYNLNETQKEVVNRIIQQFDFGMAGIDFILDSCGNMILNEIEDVVGARMLYQCNPGFDIAREYLRYIFGKKLHIV